MFGSSLLIALVITLQAAGDPAPRPPALPTYLHGLSGAHGPLAFSWASLAFDPHGDEAYVVNGADQTVRIFGAGGMEEFSFGNDRALGNVAGVAALESGELLVLSHLGGEASLLHCNFRGELKERLELTGLPPEFADFRPDKLRYARGRVYLADRARMRVLVTDTEGRHLASHDLAALLDVADRRAEVGIRGFSVDEQGNILFTAPTLFLAFVLSPSGELRGFGRAGSSPGRFNIIGGIVADERGTLYVTDVLRSVVMVFDPEFKFLGEFGYRGPEPENLVAPDEVVIGNGRLYVSQSQRRGISVFELPTLRTTPSTPGDGTTPVAKTEAVRP